MRIAVVVDDFAAALADLALQATDLINGAAMFQHPDPLGHPLRNYMRVDLAGAQRRVGDADAVSLKGGNYPSKAAGDVINCCLDCASFEIGRLELPERAAPFGIG